ncbi:MAG: choice-of-anchor Q domain-containing protein [Bacteroidota bacterium]
MIHIDRLTRWHAFVLSTIALVLALAGNSPANAATFTVTTTADAGAGSLRQAVLDANAAAGADIIDFSLPAGPQTITLTTGEIVVSSNVAINGTGASMLTISGNGSSRIFYVTQPVTISDMTLTAGNSIGAVYPGFGGAIMVLGGSLTMNDCVVRNNTASATAGAIAMGFATVNLNRCTVSGNVCGNVSGLYLQDGTTVINSCTINGNSGPGISEAIRNNAANGTTSLTLINSTVSGNTAGTGNSAIRGQGGASGTSSITLVNSTITQNTTNAAGQHGAIWLQPGPTHMLLLQNTIVSGNLSGGLPYDIDGSADPASTNNLIGTGGGLSNGVNGNIVGVNDPILGPLQNNGGPTATHEPLCSSPAIDAGSNSVTGLPYSLTTDQRGAGFARSSHGTVDIGAYEAVISSSIVTNTMNSGVGSLRDAINFANANPGPDVITFCIPKTDPGYDALSGAYTIIPLTGLPALGSDLVVDGWSQSGFAGSPIIELNGSSTAGSFGFVINNASHVTVRGFVINRFLGNPGNGIGIGVFGAGATDNWINGCYIGTNVAGTLAQPNGQIGIWVSGGPSGNTIGTNADGVNDAAERNVISGNNRSAVEINSNNNVVAGNYLGVNATGTAAIPNGEQGVRFLGTAAGNMVGGTVPSARNVISGNVLHGVLIENPATDNSVLGNLIGTNAAGTAGIANNAGIGVFASGNMIGGPGTSMRNIISGNNAAGIYLFGDGNTVQGNYIGTDITGNSAVPNAATIFHTAIWCSGNNNLIGGVLPGTGNVVAGNNHYGIFVGYTTATGNVIQGNLVGLNAGGTAVLSNRLEGVYLHGPGNTLGGASPAARNVIAGSFLEDGVEVSGNSNIVEGNYIGTDITGSVALANQKSGVFVNGAMNTVIGGATSGAGNLVSGNTLDGITVSGVTATGTLIQGNKVGTNAAGSSAVGNHRWGIQLNMKSSGTLIGTNADGIDDVAERNLISGNGGSTYDGIGIIDASSNTVAGNYIGSDISGTSSVGNFYAGVFLAGVTYGGSTGATSNTIGGTNPAASNLIVGNGAFGVQIDDPGTDGNLIQGNVIGTLAMPNGAGIILGSFGAGSTPMNNQIGGTLSGAGNLISCNTNQGIIVRGGAMKNSILGNSIFANGALGIDLGTAGNTANDAADGDTGPNGLQNYPVITSTSDVCGNAMIHGSFNSTPNSTFALEIFMNSHCDASNFGEGQTLIGTTSVSTDGSGDATFALALGGPLTLGKFLTATATDAAGNTSEFSQCYTVVAPDIDVPVVANNYGPVDLGTWSDYTFTIDNTGTGPLAITGVSITGANASEFSVQTAPAATVAPSGSTTMVIRFAPTTAPLAIKTATVSITNDDPCGNENPVDIAVSGYGIPALPHEYLLLAKKEISIDAQAGFDGNIRSNGKVEIHKGNPSTYNGDIWAVSKITIEKDNTVFGNLMSSSLNISSGATISGTQTLTAPPSYAIPSMSYSAGSAKITVSSNGSYTLAPGSYGEVKVNSGGTLYLSSGVYFMKKLEVKKDAIVSIDITNGPVGVNVVEKISFDKDTEVSITPLGVSGTRWVTFNSLQGVSIDKNSRFLGTINAPNDDVEIKKEVSFKGSICAKEISIDKDGTTLYHTSNTFLPKLSPAVTGDAGSASFTLDQNYPNPFNPSTVIEYTLQSTERVMLKVFDPMGREVETLVNRELEAGRYSATFDATNYRSGVYLYQLTVGDHQETRRMTLLK